MGGTWERFGSGRTIVSVDETNENFNAVEKIGGNINSTIALLNMPNHNHSIPVLTNKTVSSASHQHSTPKIEINSGISGAHVHDSWTSYTADATLTSGMSGLSTAGYSWIPAGTKGKKIWIAEGSISHSHSVNITSRTSGTSGAHSHAFSTVKNTTGSSGSGRSFTNLEPYITVYMWKRIS